MEKKLELSQAQEKFINAFLTEKTILKACRKAEISAVTYYSWLKEPLFKEKLKEEANKTFFEARQKVKKASIKAVEVLESLFDCKEINQKRLSAQALLELAYKDKDEELEDRLERLEKIIIERKVYR